MFIGRNYDYTEKEDFAKHVESLLNSMGSNYTALPQYAYAPEDSNKPMQLIGWRIQLKYD